MRWTRTAVGIVVFGIAAAGAAADPSSFGTTATSYLSIGPASFQPINSTQAYSVVYRLSASSGTFITYPQLPSGALLTSVEWDFCLAADGLSPTLDVFPLDRTGNEIPGGSAVNSVPVAAGCRTVVQDLTASNLVFKNHENRLSVSFNVASPVEVVGAVIGYKLQVSPAPATATFPDVPTGDFGFQYVEALVASGITGGCGGGNYCPDGPVTRRQMAIFISKALGLQWP